MSLFVTMLPLRAAHARFIDMPNGSTAWMEMSSDACFSGVAASGVDCAGSNQLGANPPNGIPLQTFFGNAGRQQVTGSAELSADRIHSFLSGNATSFMYVSFQDRYTVHGTPTEPFAVTVMLNMTGVMRTFPLAGTTAHGLVGGNVVAEIGTFSPASNSSFREQFRVNSFAGAEVIFAPTTTFQAAPYSIPFDITARHTVANLSVGDDFTLAFGANSAFAFGEIDMLNTGSISFLLPAGVSITSTGGYSQAAAVPEPAEWLLWAAGLLTLTQTARRRP